MRRRIARPSPLPALALIAIGGAIAAQEPFRPGDRGGRPPMPPLPVVEALDADRDGTLSADEIAGAAAALLTLDRNGDHNLTTDELMPDFGRRGGRRGSGGFGGPGGPGGGPMGMPALHPVMSTLDKDGDGELFEDEITDAPASLRRLDKDGDARLADGEMAPPRGGPGMRGPGGPGRRGGFRGFGGRDGTDRYGDRTPSPDELAPEDGTGAIADRATFERLSYQGDEVMIDTHLAGMEFVKFQLEQADSERPRMYFMNTETHRAHPQFMQRIGLSERDRGGRMRGVLVYRPNLVAPNGDLGLYTFEFEPEDAFPFDRIAVAYRQLVEHAPLLAGRLAYNLLPRAKQRWATEREAYAAAQLPVFDPDDHYADVGYLPLHRALSYGRLRRMQPGERPGQRDIVLYQTLPNELPRVAGILTAARQTPLSHVNLRAIQDGVPNAYVAQAADTPAIAELVGRWVRYEVRADGYTLREASADEVEAHFAALRPKAPQVPARDLSVTAIRSFAEIGFADAASVGVKAANLATLRTFGFAPERTPDGYAVPFALYDAVMRHNGLYDRARAMLAAADFQADAAVRERELARLRKDIEKAELPDAVAAALAEVQGRFPPDTAIRCRSSTNNEDLPGFSGAGLYDSFTHRPDEGHLGKSVRQVWASLWNFRAFEEREFYRVDHFAAAMGVALHPNSKGERANGVAVTRDILTGGPDRRMTLYYVNAQVGEDLVTNPLAESVPEELLLSPRNPARDRVVRRSNRTGGEPLLAADQLLALRRCLRAVHERFAALYGGTDDPDFAMEVEFKIEADGRLLVKQARPWVE